MPPPTPPVPIPAQPNPGDDIETVFFQRPVMTAPSAPPAAGLSSSFPGAIKTVQLAQLQSRHSHRIERQDADQPFINCNIQPLAAATAGGGPQADSTTGVVKWYSSRKRYGFITDIGSQNDYFVHCEDLKPQQCGSPHLVSGEYVEYTKGTADDGRLKACEVRGPNQGPLLCDQLSGDAGFR